MTMAQIEYDVIPDDEAWVLVDEDNMSESREHRTRSTVLESVLACRIAQTAWDAEVGCNRGLRWDPKHTRWGVDPDVYLMVPKPPAQYTQVSLRTWDAGVSPPLVAVEFVSENNARKDYEIAPDKYAASGTYELWVFDPSSSGRGCAAVPTCSRCGAATRAGASAASTPATARPTARRSPRGSW